MGAKGEKLGAKGEKLGAKGEKLGAVFFTILHIEAVLWKTFRTICNYVHMQAKGEKLGVVT